MLERFLNACESARISLTGIARPSRIRVVARVSPRNLRRLMRLADEHGCRVAEVSRHGLYALSRRVLVRPALIAGLCIALFAGILSTQFVLGVRVSGVEDEQAQAVFERAAIRGAKRGALWGMLDQGGLQRALEQDLDFAQKVLVHKRGVVMEIEVLPYITGPPLFEKGEVCDIVASRGAIIHSIVALEGTPHAKVGDVVRRGDVLIRGTFMRNYGEGKERFVQARGIVMGRIAYMGTARVSLEAQSYEKTGREATLRTLDIASWHIALDEGTPFEDSILVRVSQAPIVGHVLPARVTQKTYAEVKTVSRRLSYAEAERTGVAYARREAQKQIPLGVSEYHQTVYSELTEDRHVVVRVYLSALVPIGMENRQMMTEPLLYIPKYW